MKESNISETSRTPALHVQPQQSRVQIKGKLLPENPQQFFTDMAREIDPLMTSAQDTVKVDCSLVYMNTGGAKGMLHFLERLTTKTNKENGVTVLWHYEKDDYDSKEIGETFRDALPMPVELVEVATI